MDLLDVLVDPGLVGGALDERGLDVGALDALLDVGDEHVGDLLGGAAEEELGQVVVGVDAGAGDDLQAGLLGDAAHELDVAAEEHRRRIADRLHAELDRRRCGLDGGVVVLARLEPALGDPACRAGARPLRVDGLVLGAQVLVDQRRPELARVDRPGDCFDRRHLSAAEPISTRGQMSLTTAITIEATRQATRTIIM